MKQNRNFVLILLLALSIPLSTTINNITLVLLAISTAVLILKSKKYWSINFSSTLMISLFIWMVLSFFWSIDTSKTLKAIPKEISLLVIPLVFSYKNLITKDLIHKIFKFYSYGIVVFVLFHLIKATIKYFIIFDSSVFFYHGEYDNDLGLVKKELNAIHVSVFVSLAYFYLLQNEFQNRISKIAIAILFTFVILLSSKNIILIFILLNLIYLLFYSKTANKMRLRNLLILFVCLGALFSTGKIIQRFKAELNTKSIKSLSHNVLNGLPESVHVLSVKEAWNNEKFTPNDFFSGTAFRVYQLRLFTEFLKEEPIFLKGFGLNASYKKIEEKGKYYNVFQGNESTEGYQKKNFHNQYIQNFADLGIVGLTILLLLLAINLKNALISKDFLYLSFVILMISLFLTESFLWRQRGVVFFSLFTCLFNYRFYLYKKSK